MKVYLAGPMTGYAHFNFPAFDAAEADLNERGFDVVPPADLHDSVIREQVFQSADGDIGSVSATTWGECLANDVRMIADDGIEGVVVMDGWEQSRGARLEVFVALLCGLPIFYYGNDPLRRVEPWELEDAICSVVP